MPCATKIISKRKIRQSKECKEKLMTLLAGEIDTMAQLQKLADHPNIMKIFDFYEDAEYYYFVVEMVAGGTLCDYL